jgi:hypothetical protein
MNGVGLQAVQEEDFGIVIHEDLKRAKQYAKFEGKANRTVSLIKRMFWTFNGVCVSQIVYRFS